MGKLFTVFIVLGFGMGMFGSADAASKKPMQSQQKDVRSGMTEAQKKELRKRGWEWCRQFATGGTYIVRVEILQSGKVRCTLKE